MVDITYNTSGKSLQAPQFVVGSPLTRATNSVPAFQFSVLKCKPQILATKTIYADGKVRPYDNAKQFLFHYREFETLEEFAWALGLLANEPRCFIIRGQLKSGFAGWQYRRLQDHSDGPATIECPPRRWIPIDVDGVCVPAGLGKPDKLVEAGYHVRDEMLPQAFRGIRCVVSCTSGTGRKGLIVAQLRLFFMLKEAVDNELLYSWLERINLNGHPFIDHSVIRAHQPIYTARPIFDRCTDPVPEWGRVKILDGYDDVVEPDLSRLRKRAKKAPEWHPIPIVSGECPSELLDAIAKEDIHAGVHAVEETSEKAWLAIKRIFEMLDGCPKGNGVGRHVTLRDCAWELVHLVAEGEMTMDLARESYLRAADGINNTDGKYTTKAIEDRFDDAVNKMYLRS